MKNVLIAILTLTTVVVGYMAATSTLRLSLEGLQGKTETIARGDLIIPINATGEILPARRVVIKAEASGEVIEIAKQPGDRVSAADLLVRLQPDDEERSVNRARLDLKVAEARREEARINLQQARTADLQAAAANVQQIEASLRLSKYRATRADELMVTTRVFRHADRVRSYELLVDILRDQIRT